MKEPKNNKLNEITGTMQSMINYKLVNELREQLNNLE